MGFLRFKCHLPTCLEQPLAEIKVYIVLLQWSCVDCVLGSVMPLGDASHSRLCLSLVPRALGSFFDFWPFAL